MNLTFHWRVTKVRHYNQPSDDPYWLEHLKYLLEEKPEKLRRLFQEGKLKEYLDDLASRAIKAHYQLEQKGASYEQAQEKVRAELQKLAAQPRAAPTPTQVDAAIPVQGENVFQKLTDTELGVLQMIMDLGEGSVPEIRNKIGKTREHTARLLKKLYDSGFIDRNTSGMPYRYSVRKEIRDLLLEKREQSAISL